MDLTIPLQLEPENENITLNIRVAVILESSKGYFLEQNKKGWYFFIGGRIKVGENSLQAAKREMFEETGLVIDNFEFVSIIENLYNSDSENKPGKVHEICFVYKTEKINSIDEKFGLKEFTATEMQNMDIRPNKIKELVLSNQLNKITQHII